MNTLSRPLSYFFTDKKIITTVILWGLAFIGLGQARLVRSHLGLSPDWFSLSFYFVIPTLLWTLATPLLQQLTTKIPPALNWKPVLIHIGISAMFVVILKLIALVIDFSIQANLGTMHGSLADFLFQCQYLFLSSLPENLILYWAILFFLHYNKKANTSAGENKVYRNSIIAKTDDSEVELVGADIMYIEAFGNYVKVHTLLKSFCIRGTLKVILKDLNPQQFFQVHRSIIINHHFINSIKSLDNGNYQIVLAHQNAIRTGRQYRSAVRSLLPKLGGRN